MGALPTTKRYLVHTVLWVGAVLAVPLWREFREPDQPAWNIFLAVLLIALVGGTFFGVRHLQKNAIDVGEARFTPKRADEHNV